jgi:hypothetical protein
MRIKKHARIFSNSNPPHRLDKPAPPYPLRAKPPAFPPMRLAVRPSRQIVRAGGGETRREDPLPLLRRTGRPPGVPLNTLSARRANKGHSRNAREAAPPPSVAAPLRQNAPLCAVGSNRLSASRCRAPPHNRHSAYLAGGIPAGLPARQPRPAAAAQPPPLKLPAGKTRKPPSEPRRPADAGGLETIPPVTSPAKPHRGCPDGKDAPKPRSGADREDGMRPQGGNRRDGTEAAKRRGERRRCGKCLTGHRIRLTSIYLIPVTYIFLYMSYMSLKNK